jgi:hypothetical protein
MNRQRPTSDISNLLILCNNHLHPQKFTKFGSLEKLIQTATQSQSTRKLFHLIMQRQQGHCYITAVVGVRLQMGYMKSQ